MYFFLLIAFVAPSSIIKDNFFSFKTLISIHTERVQQAGNLRLLNHPEIALSCEAMMNNETLQRVELFHTMSKSTDANMDKDLYSVGFLRSKLYSNAQM